jgi:hypothetical protein
MARQRVFAVIAQEKRQQNHSNMARSRKGPQEQAEKRRRLALADKEGSNRHGSSSDNYPRNETTRRENMSVHGQSELSCTVEILSHRVHFFASCPFHRDISITIVCVFARSIVFWKSFIFSPHAFRLTISQSCSFTKGVVTKTAVIPTKLPW